MDIVAEIVRLFDERGQSAYFGEPVSQLEHALQSAHLAELEGAANAVIVAALLHDVGHLLHDEGEDIAERGIDTRHEQAGGAWLGRHFGPEVAGPVALHVAAKRYLCATDSEYRARLSVASQQSLALQGGVYDTEEIAAFKKKPYYREAVQLRRYDDRAKIPGLKVPGLDHYRPRIEAACRRAAHS